MMQIIDELKLKENQDKFSNGRRNERPTMKIAKIYLDMVMCLCSFARAVRSADRNLRLSSLNCFTKYFFAVDLRNYSATSAWHIAEMHDLKERDRETWEELSKGA